MQYRNNPDDKTCRIPDNGIRGEWKRALADDTDYNTCRIERFEPNRAPVTMTGQGFLDP